MMGLTRGFARIRRVSYSATIASAVAMAVLGVPATASADGAPLASIAQTAVNGPGWDAYRVHLSSASSIQIGLTDSAYPEWPATLVWLFDGSGNLQLEIGSVEGEGLNPDTAVQIRNNLALQTRLQSNIYAPGVDPGPYFFSLQIADLPPGDWIAAIQYAAESPFAGDVNVQAAPGSGITSETAGTNVFLRHAGDFTGPLDVFTNLGSVEVAAISGASDRETTSAPLYGFFFQGGQPSAAIGYDGPAGSQDGAAQYSFVGATPGAYRFRIDQDFGAGQTAVGDPDVYLMAGELILP
jgi:hypothetical protein